MTMHVLSTRTGDSIAQFGDLADMIAYLHRVEMDDPAILSVLAIAMIEASELVYATDELEDLELVDAHLRETLGFVPGREVCV